MHITIATRAGACVIGLALAAIMVGTINAQEPMPTMPAPAPSPETDPYPGFESFEDLSPITEVGALEPAPAEVSEPPAAEVEQPAPAPIASSPAPAPAAEQAEPATALPSGLPATGASSTATATGVLQFSVVVLLVGAACVALSRKLRRA